MRRVGALFWGHGGFCAAHDFEQSAFYITWFEHHAVVTAFQECCVGFDREPFFGVLVVVTGRAVVAQDWGDVSVEVWGGILRCGGERSEEHSEGGWEEAAMTHGVGRGSLSGLGRQC